MRAPHTPADPPPDRPEIEEGRLRHAAVKARGVVIAGKDYEHDDALDLWYRRDGERRLLDTTFRAIFLQMVRDEMIYDRVSDFLEAVEYTALMRAHGYLEEYRGRSGEALRFDQVNVANRPGIIALVNYTFAVLRRGSHKTNPAHQTGSVLPGFREYHLRRNQEGRATTAITRDKKLMIYYCTTHRAATYNYHLVTTDVTIDFQGERLTRAVPLWAGDRDPMFPIPPCGGSTDFGAINKLNPHALPRGRGAGAGAAGGAAGAGAGRD